MADVKRCPHCDAKMVEYKHSLSKSLARVLYRISQHLDANREFHVGSCNLTNSQINNLQKLRYWGIIEKRADEKRKGGYWRVTDVGLWFMEGRTVLRKYVWTYRGEFVRFDGPQVLISELTDGWKYRPDYARESVPAQSAKQGSLL